MRAMSSDSPNSLTRCVEVTGVTLARKSLARTVTVRSVRSIKSWRLPALAALISLPILGACAQPVVVDAAENAADPLCAEMILGAPNELAGFKKLKTTAQATTAWGDDDTPPVVLRCGVEMLQPTTDECLGIAPPRGGEDIDWVITNAEEEWIFTTYGRVPGLELTVPHAFPGDQPSALLADLARIAQKGEAVRSCL